MSIIIETDGRSNVDILKDLRAEASRILRSIPSEDRAEASRQNGMAWGGRPCVLGTILIPETQLRAKILWNRESGEVRVAPLGLGWKKASRLKSDFGRYLSFDAVLDKISRGWADPKFALVKSYGAAKTRNKRIAASAPDRGAKDEEIAPSETPVNDKESGHVQTN